MKCHECGELLAAYIDGLLDADGHNRIESHLAECSACRAELDAVRQLTVRLARHGRAAPRVSFETAVMDRIVHVQTREIRRLKMRKRFRVLGLSGAATVTAALLLVSNFWSVQPAAAEKSAATVLAQGAEAVQNPSTVHIVAKMRTIGHDNFSMIGADYEFVPVEIWRQFGHKSKWRVEKPGRVAVMNGDSTEMLVQPDVVVQFPKPSYGAFDTGWLLALANVQDMITHELRAAQARGWKLTMGHETVAAGEILRVTVEAKSGLPADDYLKNKFFEDADMRRVYRFDAKTKRLEGFDAYLHQKSGDVLILTVRQIDYDKPIDPAVFVLKLPEKVNLVREPQRLPDNQKYERMTPAEAAKAFFEACAKKNWNEVQKFLSPCDERLKDYLGGLEIIRLGTPFRSKGYGGWFVPYEIRVTAKVKIVVRNDNPAKRWIVLMNPERVPNAKTLAAMTTLPDNEKYEKMTPKEAVEAFFDACKRKDIDEVQKFLDGSEASRVTAKDLEDTRYADVRVGEPVEAKDAGSWRVPIEIRFINKHNLALRSDNAAKRFIVDGGI
jgi:hypothetical protein